MTAPDERFMELAIRLGRRTLGATGANPNVGCVVVRLEGALPRIVGRGWTGIGGRPHAETEALARAGSEARAATAYVTLEPCAHHGRTPPCAEALIAAGVARVVSAIEDPDPRVAGAGHARLRAAGIEVATGMLAQAARREHAGFLSRILRGRPHVLLKLAMSADAKIAERRGVATAITGAAARAAAQRMRAESDAILIGRGTAVTDDPELTCRLPDLEERSPLRVVLDTHAALPLGSKLVRSARIVPVWLIVGEGLARERRETLEGQGVEVLALAPTGARPTVAAVLGRLAGRGINRLMVEGGGEVARSFLEAGLVDEIALFRSARTFGHQGVDALAGLRLDEILPAFAAVEERPLGRDTLSRYERRE